MLLSDFLEAEVKTRTASRWDASTTFALRGCSAEARRDIGLRLSGWSLAGGESGSVWVLTPAEHRNRSSTGSSSSGIE